MRLNLKFSKTCTGATLVLALTIAIVAAVANISPVMADQCSAQLSYPVMPTSYYNSYSTVSITVPVSVSCAYISSPLYAVGTAYDSTDNSNVGTANAVLSPSYGGVFNGQLVFGLQPSVQGHTVQVSVSIYNNGYNVPYYGGYNYQNNGAVLTTAYISFQVYGNYYPYNQYPTYPTYPTYPSYTYPSYSSYYPRYSTPTRPYNNNYNYYYYGRTFTGSCRYGFHVYGNHVCMYR
jgi:hypothetical protein